MYMSNWYKDFNYSNNLILKSKKVADEIALVDSYGSLKPLEVYKFFKNIIKINKDTKNWMPLSITTRGSGFS